MLAAKLALISGDDENSPIKTERPRLACEQRMAVIYTGSGTPEGIPFPVPEPILDMSFETPSPLL